MNTARGLYMVPLADFPCQKFGIMIGGGDVADCEVAMTAALSDDALTPVAALKAAVAQFAAERDWGRFHSPKNLAMSIAIEAAELMELFQWVDGNEATARLQDTALRDRAASELADVLIYCLTLADVLDVDVSGSVARKLDANERKYPLGSPQVLDPTGAPEG